MNSRRLMGLPLWGTDPGQAEATTLRATPVVHYNKFWRPMSQMGQAQSFGDVGSMSGLPESGHGWTKQSRVYFLSRLSLGKIAEL